jgi:LysM repeat protein
MRQEMDFPVWKTQIFAFSADVWQVAPMKFAYATLSTAVVLLAASCTNSTMSGEHPVGTGPFDSRGYYIEAWADNPAKWRGGDRKPTPPRTTTPPVRPPQATASNQRPTQQTRPTQTAQNRPTATPQPRPQPRPQPQAQRRYTVKRGDTLSGIASRHRTTVAALRRANGISGDLIRPGQVLRIP